MFHFTLFFHFTIFHLLPYSQDNTMTESALLLVFFLTNQKLSVDYQCHVPRDYLAQNMVPFLQVGCGNAGSREVLMDCGFCVYSKAFFELGIK